MKKLLQTFDVETDPLKREMKSLFKKGLRAGDYDVMAVWCNSHGCTFSQTTRISIKSATDTHAYGLAIGDLLSFNGIKHYEQITLRRVR